MILIVDDHPDNGELLAQLLTADGYEATCVHSGKEAIDSIAGALPTVVVLDDFMPEMTGLDVIKKLRQNPQYASLPIVFYSAGTDLARRQKAKELGAADWLVKGSTSWPEVVRRISALVGTSAD